MFAYSWKAFEEENKTCFRAYGINEEGKNICLHISDFLPYVYIELPWKSEWTENMLNKVKSKISQISQSRGFEPVEMSFEKKRKYYYAHLDADMKDIFFPFIKCHFYLKSHASYIANILKRGKQYVDGLGYVLLLVHEIEAKPFLQMTCEQDIFPAGWLNFSGDLVPTEEKSTFCDLEYNVAYKNISASDRGDIVVPKILSFDIEVYSSNPTMMPRPHIDEDKIFQISCVLNYQIDGCSKFLLSLGNPEMPSSSRDIQVLKFARECDLISGFANFIHKSKPNCLIGYNILGFDFQYMIDRANNSSVNCFTELTRLGMHKFDPAEVTEIKWSSSAYKNQEFKYLAIEGILILDFLPIVRRDFKLTDYKLKTVSTHFLKETKDDLSPQEIFQLYETGICEKKSSGLGRIGKYCIQDSLLVLNLMNKLQTWSSLVEMSKICQVQLFDLYTKGQQLKVYSQIYGYGMKNDIVIDKKEVSTGDAYAGAYVFDPEPGLYYNVVPFDFASLYPSIIIAKNICHSTCVLDENIPDSACTVIEFEDHIGCAHDKKIIRREELPEKIKEIREEISTLTEKEKGRLAARQKIDERQNSTFCPQDPESAAYQKRMLNTNILSIRKKLDELKRELSPLLREKTSLTAYKPKNTICKSRKFRFLKGRKGVIPTIIQNLLDARKAAKNKMKQIGEKINNLKTQGSPQSEIKSLQIDLTVLDLRQNALKVSANSMYGFFGVGAGYLPFMPAAMSITYIARVSIQKVANFITENYNGKLVYGDTDSNYFTFPHIKIEQDETEGKVNVTELWNFAVDVAAETSKQFEAPMKLEFEEKIYLSFLMVTKKRYLYTEARKDGSVVDKIGKKGVLLVRRDYNEYARIIYQKVISDIFQKKSQNETIQNLLSDIHILPYISRVQPQQFITTKAVGNIGNLDFSSLQPDEKGKIILGDYKVPILSTDPATRRAQLLKKEAKNEKDYYLSWLPAHVQLAQKMRSRGQRVENGSRLGYVITDLYNFDGKQYEKIEDLGFYANNKFFMNMDYLFYLKTFIKPFGQILEIVFPEESKFVDRQHIYLKKKVLMMRELKSKFQSKLVFHSK